MFEKEVGRGRGLNRKKSPDTVQQKKTHRNPAQKQTKTQVETETRKHAQDFLVYNLCQRRWRLLGGFGKT